MNKSRLSLALAAAFAFTLGLSACSDPDDQRGDPTDPTQQTEETSEAPATERDARAQALREEHDISRDTYMEDDIDPAASPERQPASAIEYMLARNVSSLGDIDDPTTVRTHQQEHAELEIEIRDYLQHAEADDINQCALIPYGHKPCGGPESYLVYSQRDMSEEDIQELQDKVARYNQLDAFLKAAQGMMSTCDVTPKPEVSIENGRCVAESHRASL